MANVTTDIQPSSYLDPQTAHFLLSDQVEYISFTQNGAQPAISEYIAYDQLTPPTPFLAVTQDGKGRVVYDGGFPKFYNTSAPSAGIDSLFSMEYRGTLAADSPGGINSYYYDAFTDVPVTIAAGDRLVYDMLQNSVDARVGIDAITANSGTGTSFNYSLRDWGQQGGVLRDQNGLLVHPATDLGTRAVNQWYHRTFDLSAAAGATFIKWSLAYEGEKAGVFYTRFKEVYILDKNGAIKATLFKDVIKLPNSSSTEAGAQGYTNTSKQIYDPRSHLTASFKYLFNAIRWTADPAKVAAGNRKILIMGDLTSENNYSVKGTIGGAFFTSFTNLCSAVGFTPTFKDVGDYAGGYLNATLAEMSAYTCILVMGAAGGGDPKITNACVQDMQSFRASGGGLILITDDGPDIPNIGAAYPPPQVARQFFVTVNKIAVNFGAYFTGNFDRTPVNVGFLRSTYGDHPLYDGMLDSESIAAGGSESKVVVATYPTYTQATAPPITMTSGRYTLRVLARLKDGSIETYQFVFSIAAGNVVEIRDVTNKAITQLNVGFSKEATVYPVIIGAGLGTLTGQVTVAGVKVADMTFTEAGGSVVTWLDGTPAFNVNNGDVIRAEVTAPFATHADVPVTRFQPDLSKASSPAAVMALLRPFFGTSATKSPLQEAMIEIGVEYKSDFPRNINVLLDFLKR